MPPPGGGDHDHKPLRRGTHGNSTKPVAHIDNGSNLEETLITIRDLEDAIQSRQSESMRSAYRQKLCSLLSDFLLNQPHQLSVDKDIVGTLWRTCFYDRINEIREQIGREQKKLKRLKQQAEKEATTGERRQLVDPKTGKKIKGNAKSNVSPQVIDRRKLEEVEAFFKTFLTESIAMYDALVEKFQSYRSEIMRRRKGGKAMQQKRGPQSRKESAGNGKIPNMENPTVNILFFLSIHRGDLHRYAEDYNKAEASYQISFALLPGKGNPYNQMAVISQLKDQACLALYYYARSLCATHESFPTSKSNLRRLFQANRDWLKNHGGKQAKMRSILDAGAGKLNKEKKTGAVKLFLAEYVGVHGLYAEFASSNNATASDGDDTDFEVQLETKMNAIIEMSDLVLTHLQYLLNEQCLGDSLVLKMGLINIFNVHSMYHLCIKQRQANGAVPSVVLNEIEYMQCLPALALNFTYRFGDVLVDQLITSLQQMQKMETNNNGFDSVSVTSGGDRSQDGTGSGNKDNHGKRNVRQLRLLSCLGMCCDWLRLERMEDVLTNKDSKVKVSDRAAAVAENGRQIFYTKLAEFWNELLKTQEYAVFLEGKDKFNEGTSRLSNLKEHYVLRGFSPLASVVSQDDDYEWEHVPNGKEMSLRLSRIFQTIKRTCVRGRDGTYVFAGDGNCLEDTEEVSAKEPAESNAVQHILNRNEAMQHESTLQPRESSKLFSSNPAQSTHEVPPGLLSSPRAFDSNSRAQSDWPSSSMPPGFHNEEKTTVVTANPFLHDASFNEVSMTEGVVDPNEANMGSRFDFSLFLNNGVEKARPMREESRLESLLWGGVNSNVQAASIDQRVHVQQDTRGARISDNPWEATSTFDPMNVDIQDSAILRGLHFSDSGREHSRLPAANENVSSRNPFLT